MLKYTHPTLAWLLHYWPATIFLPAILLLIAVLAAVTKRWDRRDAACVRVSLVVLAVGLVVLLAGVGLGVSSRTPLDTLARGGVAVQIPCGSYYWPVASHDPIATDSTATGLPQAERDEECAAKNLTTWSVVAWLVTLGGAVLLAVGAVQAALGASRGGRAARA